MRSEASMQKNVVNSIESALIFQNLLWKRRRNYHPKKFKASLSQYNVQDSLQICVKPLWLGFCIPQKDHWVAIAFAVPSFNTLGVFLHIVARKRKDAIMEKFYLYFKVPLEKRQAFLRSCAPLIVRKIEAKRVQKEVEIPNSAQIKPQQKHKKQ